LTGSISTCINAPGAIAGYYDDSQNMFRGFVRAADGTFATFAAPAVGSLETDGTFPESINTAGDIAGYYTDANGAHGFVRDASGAIATFDVPGASQGTYAASINAAGTVAGYYFDSSGEKTGIAASCAPPTATSPRSPLRALA
jgi:hypothetical protein